MSDDNEDNFDVETNFETEGVRQEAEPEQKEEDNSNWLDREGWAAAGKDPDEWRSKKTHNDFAGLVTANQYNKQEIKHLKDKYEYDFQNIKTYHNAQLQQQYAKLDVDRMEAIELADTDQVKNIENQMGNIQQQQQTISPQQQQQNQAIANWYNDIMAANPGKEVELENAIAGALQRNPGNMNAIADDVEAYVKRISKPATNPRRNAPSSSSTGKTGGGGKITMSDITPEEMEQRNFFKQPGRSQEENDKAFINAVKTSRKMEG